MPTEKTQIAAYVSTSEHAKIESLAHKAGLSIANFIRVKLGLEPLKTGRPKK